MAGRRDIFEEAIKRGHSAAWDQQWEKAIACYRAALTEFPDDATALTAAGFALLQADRPEEALTTYQRAAVLTPGDPVAPEKCAEIFEQLGRVTEAAQTYAAVAEIHIARRDVQKAIDNWVRSVRLMPDNLNAHSRLALALERNNQPRAAALEYIEIARLFQRGNQLENAGQAVARALQLEPKLPEGRDAIDKLKRGQPIPIPDKSKVLRPRMTGMLSPEALAEFRDSDSGRSEADKFWGEAVGEEDDGPAVSSSPIAPAKETALAHLAEILFEEDADTSKTATSVSAITRGAANSLRDEESQRAQAVMYLGQGINKAAVDAAAAASNFASALEAGLQHPLIHFMIGALSLEVNNYEEAIEHLTPTVSRDDVALGALYGLGEAYARTGDARKAASHLLEALKRLDLQIAVPAQHDALAESYESLAESLARASNSDLAKILPDLMRFFSGEDWEERARERRRQLDAESDGEAATSLGDMLATPGTDSVLESLRQIERLIRRKFYASAMEESFFAIQASPTYLPVHVRMAEILVADGKAAAAAAKYAVIADTYQIRGEAGRAAKVMQQVLNLNPLDLGSRRKLIELLTQQGRLDDALTHYAELADTHYQLADMDTAHSTYYEALQLAQRGGADRAWQARLLHQIGDIDMQKLAWREALKVYEQIKRLTPSDEKARIALIDLHFRLGNPQPAITELDAYLKNMAAQRAYGNAQVLLEELIGSYPDELPLIARLARLLQDQGRKPEAITHYERLAELQLDAGQSEAARETIRTILALGPDDPAPYQQLLSQL